MGPAIAACRIVLAEDNPADVRLVKEALRQHDIHCNLWVISDGEAILTFIRNLDSDTECQCPDLLLLDLHLPKRDGNEVLRQLRASDRCAHIQVVVLTSSDAPVDVQLGNRHAVQFFRKPISLEKFMDLGRIVREILGRPIAS